MWRWETTSTTGDLTNRTTRAILTSTTHTNRQYTLPTCRTSSSRHRISLDVLLSAVSTARVRPCSSPWQAAS